MGLFPKRAADELQGSVSNASGSSNRVIRAVRMGLDEYEAALTAEDARQAQKRA